VVDTVAPEVVTSGVRDGVTWKAGSTIQATMRDVDRGAKVVSKIRNGNGVAKTVVMDAANQTIDGTVKTANVTLATLNSEFGFQPPTAGSFAKNCEVELTISDRAGNVQTQTLYGMALNLPPLTEESVLLPDSLMPTLPDERWILDPNDPNNPNNPGDDAGGRWFVGAGGAWGYGTLSGGGGTGSWNWNNAGNGGNPLLRMPRHILDPESLIGYLPALRLMLTTAWSSLSNHPDTAAKKDALKRHLDLLMQMGEVVETNSLYETMRPMLKGVFANAYAPAGITKRQAVIQGWEFAKALAIETKLTTLQIFEANLFGASLAALKQNNQTVSNPDLETTVRALATTYARLRPIGSGELDRPNYAGGVSVDFLGSLLINGRASETGRPPGQLKETVEAAIADLAGHFQAQTNPVKALQLVDRTIQAATEVSYLHGDAYKYEYSMYYSTTVAGTNRVTASIRDTEFLDNLSELAFEIARVNPTVTEGTNPAAEWVETVWEGGEILSAADGLAQIFDGFRVVNESGTMPTYSSRYGNPMHLARQQMNQALDYMGRLVQMAEAVNDPNFDAEVLKGNTLSYLINLGGAYAALNPYSSVATDPKFFLQTLWQSSTGVSQAKAIQEFIKLLSDESFSWQDRNQLLACQQNQFLTLGKIGTLKEQARDPILLAAIVVLSRYYQSDLKSSNISSPDDNFFAGTWNANSRSQLENIATAVGNRSANFASITGDSILQVLLGSDRFLNLTQLAPVNRPPSPISSALPSNIMPWLPIDPNRPKVPTVGRSVGNKKALIIAPYAYEFESRGGDESDEIRQILLNSGFSVMMRRNNTRSENNINIQQDFMQTNLGEYGVIIFVSHGARFDGARGMSDNESNIRGSSFPGLFTGQILTSKAVLEYADLLWSKDLRFGRTTGRGEIELALMPSFIRKYMNNLGNHSLVYLGACQTLQNNSLADAFLAQGASNVVGYTRDVRSVFASAHGTAIFNVLATGRGTDQIPGIKQNQDTTGAFFSIRGNTPRANAHLSLHLR
jgi:hypothetical protein